MTAEPMTGQTPRTEAGRRLLLDSLLLGEERAAAIADILAIEAEAAADCQREMLRQRDCDHSECIEREERARAEAQPALLDERYRALAEAARARSRRDALTAYRAARAALEDSDE